jgi:polygalacturonase
MKVLNVAIAFLAMGVLFTVRCALAQNSQQPTTGPAAFKITDHGAVGDGKTVNTAAIQKALNACSAAGGGEVVVPAGNFVTGSILLGPRTILRLEKDAFLTGSPNQEDYPVVNVRWEGEWRPGHRALISMEHVDHVGVVGEGKIIGPPVALAALRPSAQRGTARGPSILEPIDCRDVRLEGFSIQYQRMWNVHLTYCQDVVVRNLNIRSTIGMSNGDGVDVDSCKNVLIEGCDLETGDDAICLKSGRGMEAVRIARPCEDVIIRNCTLSCPGFACIGIGTEMSGGVRNVRIENCKFVRAVNAIFIKSRDGRGGFIENITADGWDVGSDVQHVIHFDLRNKGIVAYETVQGLDGIPRVQNLTFNNLKTQARRLLWVTSISPDKPVEGLTLSDVTGTCQEPINISNMRNVVLRNINITGYTGDFIKAQNVTGPSFEKIKEPKDTAAGAMP